MSFFRWKYFEDAEKEQLPKRKSDKKMKKVQIWLEHFWINENQLKQH